jgi:hypothetical protein
MDAFFAGIDLLLAAYRDRGDDAADRPTECASVKKHHDGEVITDDNGWSGAKMNNISAKTTVRSVSIPIAMDEARRARGSTWKR